MEDGLEQERALPKQHHKHGLRLEREGKSRDFLSLTGALDDSRHVKLYVEVGCVRFPVEKTSVGHQL